MEAAVRYLLSPFQYLPLPWLAMTLPDSPTSPGVSGIKICLSTDSVLSIFDLKFGSEYEWRSGTLRLKGQIKWNMRKKKQHRVDICRCLCLDKVRDISYVYNSFDAIILNESRWHTNIFINLHIYKLMQTHTYMTLTFLSIYTRLFICSIKNKNNYTYLPSYRQTYTHIN